MSKVEVLNEEELTTVVGGSKGKGRNNWAGNTIGIVSSAATGAALGSAICGPGCGFVGAHWGAVGWTAVASFSGAFGKIIK